MWKVRGRRNLRPAEAGHKRVVGQAEARRDAVCDSCCSCCYSQQQLPLR